MKAVKENVHINESLFLFGFFPPKLFQSMVAMDGQFESEGRLEGKGPPSCTFPTQPPFAEEWGVLMGVGQCSIQLVAPSHTGRGPQLPSKFQVQWVLDTFPDKFRRIIRNVCSRLIKQWNLHNL